MAEPSAEQFRPGSASLARGSLARLAADATGAVTGLASSIFTARVLLPVGKGVLSAMLLISVVAGQTASFGLGDATIIAAGRGRTAIDRGLARSLGFVCVVTPLVALLLMVVLHLTFDDRFTTGPILVAVSLHMPLLAATQTLTMAVNARGGVARASRALAIGFLVNFAAVVVLVGLADLAVLGGLAASLAGIAVTLVLLLIEAWRLQLLTLPRWSIAYLREVLPDGLRIQAAYLLTALSQRVDQLVVLVILGEAAGGRYSVALAVGQFVAYAPFALSVASFPRLAGRSDEEVVLEVGAIIRVGVVAALLTAVVLFAVTPVLVPFLFGAAFRPAVAPALLLVVGGLVGSLQWLLCRCAAAVASTRIILVSFAISLVVMVAGDLALTRVAGITGAGIASLTAAVAGTVYATAATRRVLDIRVVNMVPGFDDVRAIVAFVRSPLSAGS